MFNNNWVVQFRMSNNHKWFTMTGRSNYYYQTHVMNGFKKAYSQYDYKLECLA